MSKSFADYVDEVVNGLPVTAPVFQGKVEGNSIYFEPVDKVTLDTSAVLDPVERLISESANYELFEKRSPIHESRYTRSADTKQVYMRITYTVMSVYETYSGLKNPKQSRLYKWMQEVYNNPAHDAHVGFLALYRYLGKHSERNINARSKVNVDKVHADNTLAILERMRSKYEDK